ncbi:MAG: hypothetical protein MSH66_04895 [Bacteroidales bacterium]|nr:hypothetical protein [Bacteroidales bacterium]
MKKFFLFLCALCGVLGGAAQTETLSGIGSTAITSPVSGSKYVIKTQGQASQNAYLCASATGAASAETAYTTGADGMRFVWLFTQEGDKWKITNAKTNKQLTFESTGNDGRVTLTDAGTSITLDVSGTGVGLKNASNQYIDAGWSGKSLCTWSGGVSGSRTMHIYEANIEVISTVAITYNYKYNDTQIGSETFNLAVGDSYPQTKPVGSLLSSYVDPSLLDFDFPTGTVSAAETFDVNVALSSSFPIVPGAISGGKFVAGTKWYKFTLKTKFAAYNSANDYFDASAASSDNSAPYLFAFTGDPVLEGLNIYNKAVGAGKVVYDNNPVSSDTDPIPTEASPNGKWSIGAHPTTGFWLRQGNTGTWYMNSRSSKLGFWNSSSSVGDDGSTIVFTYVESTPEELPILATKVYTVKPKEVARGALYAPTGVDFLDACGGTLGNAVHKDIAIDPNNTAQQFAFVTLSNGNTYLYSVGLRKFITESTSYKAAPVHKPTDYVTVEKSDIEGYFFIKFKGSEMLNISTGYLDEENNNVSTGNAVTGWNNADDGNRLQIEEAGDFADADAVKDFAEATIALKEKLAVLNNGFEYVGEGLNKYSANIEGYVTSVNDLNTFYNGITNETAVQTINENKDIATALNAATFTINQPARDKFYRFKNGTKYLCSTLNTTTGTDHRMTMSTEGTDATTIFYLDNESKLVAYSNGLFTQNFSGAGNYGFQAVGGTGNTVAFTDGQGAPAPRYHISCGSRYIYGENGESKLDAGGSAPAVGDTGYDWEIEEVTSLPVNVSSAVNYGTLFTPVALAVPAEGVDVYTGTINGEYLHLNPVSGTIPAGTAVVLKYTDAVKTAGSLSFATAADVDPIEVNALSGQVNTVVASGITNPYTLQNNPATGIGFYPYNGTNLNGFKAYMTTGTNPVRGFLFEEDGTTTGINALETETPGTQAIYDLSGRRVNKAQKGLYIVNGKKVILK